MKRRRQTGNTKFGIILAGLLGILYFFFLIYLKYNLNEIPIRYIRLDYIGNVMNGFLAFALVTSVIGNYFVKRTLESKRILFINTLLTISLALLLVVYMFSKLDILSTDKLVFNFPLKKVYMGAAYILSFSFQLYSALYLWSWLAKSESFLELRSIVRSAIGIVVLMVFTLVFVWNVRAYSQERIENKTFEYGCIPGAAVYSKGRPSPIFEARIRKALELYRKNIIENIILTGANAPGELTEAETAKRYLINLGVRKKNILTENRSTTTTEQIEFLSRDFGPGNSAKPVLIVSDGFHLSRIAEIAKFYRVNTVGVASDYSLSLERTIFYRTRESIALLLFWLFAI
ncbi:MAG: YdcF family protein [Bacteroidota bacterium]